MSFVVVIPARYESSRLPGKVLADIQGKPMIQWVVEKANLSGARKVIVATDNDEVADVVKSFGGEVCKTRADHQSGTERLAEVMELYQFDDNEVIVNVQGDEPFIPSRNISQVAGLIKKYHTGMATLCCPVTDSKEVKDPNTVKVIFDGNNKSIYFSRSGIPFVRESTNDSEFSLGNHYRGRGKSVRLNDSRPI